MTESDVAKVMDLAVLKPSMTDSDIRESAALCIANGIGNLCVRPSDAEFAKELLRGSATTLSVVVGFPHGSSRSEVKALEARLAIADGADELDVVMNIGRFLSDDLDYVRRDIEAVVAVAAPCDVAVKVIIESAFLSGAQIVAACETAIAAGAQFLKTSTGFNGEGATPEAVRLMIETAAGRVGVKASGGIRDWESAVRFLELGVDRLGVGSALQILAGSPE